PWDALAHAIALDLRSRASHFPGPLRSVYFGGGTPSLAPASFFETVLETARETLGIADGAEVTMEIEPDTIDPSELEERVRLGVNRASLGWQSTHKRLLRVLGRGHDTQASAEMVRAARAAGFQSLSVDLIFAVPGQRMDELDADLDAIVALDLDHVSLYALTIEPNTEFDRRRAKGRLTPVDEARELEMMRRIEERLLDVGYCHYEVSNYAKPGRAARHNSGYWLGLPYLGVGPGAHSYLPKATSARRWEGLREPDRYIRTSGREVEWEEQLGHAEVLAERLMTAMRLEQGIDISTLEFGDETDRLRAAAQTAVQRGWLRVEGSRWIPTASGRENADALGALFF
ncbi:MAG: coproporphyrinogen-III oxidase family protein, partial [Myxococcota bacterium]